MLPPRVAVKLRDMKHLSYLRDGDWKELIFFRLAELWDIPRHA
jgi:hypothetical protein